MAKKFYPLAKVYGLLEPGPVVMLTTIGGGRPNVMPMSWPTILEFETPQVCVSAIFLWAATGQQRMCH